MGVAFDGAGSWSFGDEMARNVVIFGYDIVNLNDIVNLIISRIFFLGLGEASTDDIIGSIGAAEQKFSINFSKARTNFP